MADGGPTWLPSFHSTRFPKCPTPLFQPRILVFVAPHPSVRAVSAPRGCLTRAYLWGPAALPQPFSFTNCPTAPGAHTSHSPLPPNKTQQKSFLKLPEELESGCRTWSQQLGESHSDHIPVGKNGKIPTRSLQSFIFLLRLVCGGVGDWGLVQEW